MEYDTKAPVRDFVRTAGAVLLSPGQFFSSIAPGSKEDEERLAPPVLFTMACAFIFAILGGLYELTAAVLGGGVSELSAFGLEGPVVIAVAAPLALLGYPMVSAVAVFVIAFLIHIPVMILADQQRRTYYSTLKIAAYISVTSLVLWIPVVWLIGALYQAYLTAIGVLELHKSTRVRAGIVGLLSVAVTVSGLFTSPGPVEWVLAGGLD